MNRVGRPPVHGDINQLILRILQEYIDCYNSKRPHQGIDQQDIHPDRKIKGIYQILRIGSIAVHGTE